VLRKLSKTINAAFTEEYKNKKFGLIVHEQIYDFVDSAAKNPLGLLF